MTEFYGKDLATLHHRAFGAFANDAAPGLLEILCDAGIHRGLVVDLGCGSGIWSQALVEHGYTVVGVDCSAAMIEMAQSNVPQARFFTRAVHQFGFPHCAAVTALGEVLSYQVEGAAEFSLAEVFARIAAALTPGGLLIFDLMMRSTGTAMNYSGEYSGNDWHLSLNVAEDNARSLLTRVIAMTVQESAGHSRSDVETHVLRTYDAVQVEGWLKAAGFTVQTSRYYGTMELAPQRLAFIARKRARS